MRPVTDLQRKVAPFRVVTDMVPAGDQPTAIAEIDERVRAGEKDTVLLGATGTGKTATPEIAADAHRFLRKCAERKFSSEQAQAMRILYGGSVKPDNIQGLMAQEELDGALVGGASLDAKSFASIVNGCESAQ